MEDQKQKILDRLININLIDRISFDDIIQPYLEQMSLSNPSLTKRAEAAHIILWLYRLKFHNDKIGGSTTSTIKSFNDIVSYIYDAGHYRSLKDIDITTIEIIEQEDIDILEKEVLPQLEKKCLITQSRETLSTGCLRILDVSSRLQQSANYGSLNLGCVKRYYGDPPLN